MSQIAAHSMSLPHRPTAPEALRAALAAVLRRLVKDLADPYRPELHYMRGPGPKWREKHPG